MPPKDPANRRRIARESARRRRAEKKAERAAQAVESKAKTKLIHNKYRRLAERDPALAIAQWSRDRLRVPFGRLRGEPFILAEWQIDWLRLALAEGIGEAGLSVARKNGKSGLVAVLELAHIAPDAPLLRPEWRSGVVSLTGNLAKELRDAIDKTAEISELDGIEVFRSPAPGRIAGAEGTRIDFLAADKASGHAAGFDLAVIDEGGLMTERDRPLWDAMASSVSGRDGRLLVISVRGRSPMFNELAERAGDPAVAWREFAAWPKCALDDPDAWRAANPGLDGGIKSLDYMERSSRRALSIPANAPAFMSHDLNLPVDPGRETICGLADYQLAVAGAAPEREGGVCVGVDLGGSRSLTAAAALWPQTGRLEIYCAVADDPNPMERGLSDGVGRLYVAAVESGELALHGGKVVNAARFLADVFERLRGSRILAVGADRYRQAEAKQAFAEAGLRGLRIAWRGTGASKTADGSHDVRSFQKGILRRSIRPPDSRLLESAIADSALRFDLAGNPALDKVGANARIDALQAAVIAAGLAELERSKPEQELEWFTL